MFPPKNSAGSRYARRRNGVPFLGHYQFHNLTLASSSSEKSVPYFGIQTPLYLAMQGLGVQ